MSSGGGFAAYAVVLFVLNVISSAFSAADAFGAAFLFSSLYTIVWLGTIVPMAALMVRRLHDTNQTGWLGLIPIANLIFAAGGLQADRGASTTTRPGSSRSYPERVARMRTEDLAWIFGSRGGYGAIGSAPALQAGGVRGGSSPP